MRRPSTQLLACAFTVASLLAGCSGSSDDVTANATAPAGFVPPTALNRTDFLKLLDHRFTQLDVNGDSQLSRAEIPVRHHDIIASFDTDHDGTVTKDEFEKGALARFDKADLNGDGVLTGEERHSAELVEDDGNSEAASDAAAPSNAAAASGAP